MNVYLSLDDRDFHGAGCDCGKCNANGISYGCGIYPVNGDGDVIERVYAPSEKSAQINALFTCAELGLTIVVPVPEELP